jgi:hypothetical protein
MRPLRHVSFTTLLALACVVVGPIDRAAAQSDEPSTDEAIPPPPPSEGEAVPEVAVPEIAPQPAAPALRVIVIDAATYGIDPIVGRVATDVLRRTAATLGYGVIDPAATVAAARSIRMTYPPAPADLWRATWTAQAHRGVFARIWAAEGRYVIEVAVASLDGSGPFFGRDTAGPDDLREVVARLLTSALPPPSAWNPAGVPAPTTPTVVATTPTVGPTVATPHRARDELAHPTGRDGRRWHRPEPELRRFSLAIQTEASIGTSQGSFYNHFVGARLDVRILRDLMVGLYVAYVNLEGREQRADNFFIMIQGEDRIRLASGLDLTIPLRVGVGYLAFNGPVFRISAGLNYALSENWEIGIDLIAPTFYILADRAAVAFDFSADVQYRF